MKISKEIKALAQRIKRLSHQDLIVRNLDNGKYPRRYDYFVNSSSSGIVFKA
ncbi:hypothetical protein RY831_28270 [Noviherbaspirillum sp. CPCC 100848]|uniref:Uncharacterized protein n=1 Tax=Noviherbaspirillum album TaxID=3080276 RepID=A0ABU6JHC6_9BURK|nr:hypothetical protein [Noviherbaspirillum sp. CPCC 100848]MEC4723061.1 hypothetical protein [Noviherbaspirillum sp. CPCC 100848]